TPTAGPRWRAPATTSIATSSTRPPSSTCCPTSAARFIAYAIAEERRAPLGIDYQVASAVELPFDDETFDAATAFMSLMDIPENDRAMREAYRVLKPGGFLQFSITHPCFNTVFTRAVTDADHHKIAAQVSNYFQNVDGDVAEFLFSAAPREVRAGMRPFRIPRFARTLSQWINLVLDTGFTIERVGE